MSHHPSHRYLFDSSFVRSFKWVSDPVFMWQLQVCCTILHNSHIVLLPSSSWCEGLPSDLTLPTRGRRRGHKRSWINPNLNCSPGRRCRENVCILSSLMTEIGTVNRESYLDIAVTLTETMRVTSAVHRYSDRDSHNVIIVKVRTTVTVRVNMTDTDNDNDKETFRKSDSDRNRNSKNKSTVKLTTWERHHWTVTTDRQ